MKTAVTCAGPMGPRTGGLLAEHGHAVTLIEVTDSHPATHRSHEQGSRTGREPEGPCRQRSGPAHTEPRLRRLTVFPISPTTGDIHA